MIPVEEKRDYLEALRVAPNLIKQESDPVKFLRAEDLNPWTSAMSFVKYWRYRKHLFQNRWLLPLNHSGAGALDKDDIKLLSTGWMAFASPKDSNRGRFLLVDHGKSDNHNHQSRRRVAFYLCSAASDIPAQTIGLTVVRLIPAKSEEAFTASRFSTAKAIYNMMKEALPIRFRHVCLLKLEGSEKGQMLSVFLGRVISSVLFEVLGRETQYAVSIPHASHAAKKLKDFDVPPSALPHSHGGTWSYDQMFEWRRVVEKEQDIGKLATIPWISQKARPVLSESSVRETKALYARRAYEKQKLKREAQQEEVKRLRVENERLREDNERLDSLLEKAKDVAELFKLDLWG